MEWSPVTMTSLLPALLHLDTVRNRSIRRVDNAQTNKFEIVQREVWFLVICRKDVVEGKR